MQSSDSEQLHENEQQDELSEGNEETKASTSEENEETKASTPEESDCAEMTDILERNKRFNISFEATM